MADITVRVAAKSFIKSTGTTGVTSQVRGTPLITQGSGHTIEWKVTLPAAGKWRLHALLSSHISNPCQLFINGVQQESNVLGEATGGASSDTQGWFSYGPFEFKAGENVFAIKCLKAQPSLWEFGFSLEQPATAPAPSPAPAPTASVPGPGPVSTADATFIRIPSKDFTSATPGTAGDDPGFGGTVCAVSTTPFLEYKVNLPKAGQWHFHVSLAAHDSRPATLTINGVRQQQQVCGNVTGSWLTDSRKWFVYGPFDFKKGENVFRLDFGNCMPHLKEFGFSESMLGVANVTEWPADLVTARDPATVADGSYSNLLATAKTPMSLEWKINAPAAGHYHLHALMTSDENRPGVLSINGVKQSGEVLGQKTGGWYSDKLTWVTHGPYELKQNENVLRIDFPGYHPHLRELGITLHKAAEKPVQTGPTKLGPVGSMENANEWEVLPKADGVFPRITAVTTGHNWSLGSVAAQYEYAGETAPRLQRPHVTNTTGFFEIPAGDCLVAIHVGHGAQYAGAPTNEVVTIQYETLKGLKSPVYGGQSGRPVVTNHVLRAASGQQIIGFFGANGGAQNVPLRIGVYTGALPAPKVEPNPVPQAPEKRNISGVVNEFAGVTAISGDTLTLGGNANPFKEGDRVLVIQMAGATIDTTDSDKFGTITNLGGAGYYVWATVASVGGQSVKLTGADLRAFDVKGAVQIVRACSHVGDIAVSGHIAAPQWNGTTGGVVVIESAGSIELADDIDASARGFVGGPKVVGSGGAGLLGYTYTASIGAGNKGAGIATLGAEHTGGRGAAGNGGGGGNPHNAGGGGGGNGGAGGRGASEWEGVGGGPKVNGGLGGHALDYADRAFMGGGGGAGQDNNNQSSGGGNGGGIIILKAKAISGASGRFIRANGGAAGAAQADGGGGGGAGGTILLDAPTISGAFTVQANGGRGGDCTADAGYGAGGGGGTIRSLTALPTTITATVLPGEPGTCGRPRGHTIAEKGILGLLPARPAASASPSDEEWQKLREALENRVGALEAKIVALEADLAQCKGCCAKIDSLVAELAVAQAKLDSLTSELVALRAKLDERDAKCAAYEQKIATLEKQVLEHERVHAAFEKALAKQEHSNIEQERKLLEQDKKLAEQERSNIEQERKLLEQDKKLAEQEHKNIDQERVLLEQDKKLLAQDRKLADYDAVIAALEAKLAKCGDCEAKIQELAAKLSKCGDCEAKIQEQQKSIADLTERLAKLEASRVVPAPTTTEEKPVVPPVWPPPSTPARMGISYIHFVGLEKNTQGDEYIEIKNTGGTAQDVTGWRVRAGSASQEFVFPAGSIVAPGAACRIYTNRAGEFSFNAKRAVWNDAGDIGMLYDASGKLVCEHGYGTKETRSLDNIKATYGVERMMVTYDDAQVAKQKRKNDKIDFLTAVERAIRSLLEDSADEGRPNAANQVRDNFDGVPRNANASVLQSYIRDTMNKGELQLVLSDAADPMSTKDQWIFRLRPGMGDAHWVIVDRMGAKAAYQEIT